MNISFIGFGHLGKAIAKGLLQDKNHRIRAAAPSLPVGVQENGIQTDCDNRAVLSQADVVILAVKPVQMERVFTEIHQYLPKHCLVISIAAGLNLAWFDKRGGSHIALVRTMPNVCSQIGKSATPMIANACVSETQKRQAEKIFSTIGATTWVEDEPLMDAYTALSGSGPAYVFLFMESMIKAGVRLGLDEADAKRFASQTLDGALSLARDSELGLDALRNTVTSPGGTTEAALNVFIEHGFKELVFDAMNAAFERAKELAQAL